MVLCQRHACRRWFHDMSCYTVAKLRIIIVTAKCIKIFLQKRHLPTGALFQFLLISFLLS